jgi:hypothetical protein
MNKRIDLTALPDWCYWRAGVPDLIATEADLTVRAMMDLISERSLAIELRIEGVEIDPLKFVQHLHEWTVVYTFVRLRQVLDGIVERLDDADPAQAMKEVADWVRWLQSAVPEL